MDLFVAFEQFTTCRLRPEETADEVLTDLRLTRLVGEMPPECWIKRRAADITKGCDDKVTDVLLTTMITEVVARVRQEDPVRGKWCVDGPELDIWVDASSLATRVSLEHDGAAVEDASWLQKERDMQHKLGGKGINMALMAYSH